jgi:hypothetical protein
MNAGSTTSLVLKLTLVGLILLAVAGGLLLWIAPELLMNGPVWYLEAHPELRRVVKLWWLLIPSVVIAPAVFIPWKWPETSHRRFVWFLIGLGGVTAPLGALWLLAGAGMYGSPVVGRGDWGFWMFWVVIAGPLAILPCALFEKKWPRRGGIILMALATLTAEFGIRAARMHRGTFADEDVWIVIVCLSVPLFFFGAFCVWMAARDNRRKILAALVVAALMIGAGIGLRFKHARDTWNAHAAEEWNLKHP